MRPPKSLETKLKFHSHEAGATYQMADTTLLHDMIIKSRERGKGHVPAFRKFFDRIREYKIRLNPQKCVLGVTAGTLLGFMVSQRNIEFDPSKIKALMEMPPPRFECE